MAATALAVPAATLDPQNVVECIPASPLDLPAEIFAAGLDRRRRNRAALMAWIREALIEGTDYGRIHTASRQRCQLAAQGRTHDCENPQHWSKPSLFKPGAEKICGMLGVTVSFPTLSEYEQAALNGAELKHVVIRCEIKDASGRIVADGVGARSLAQDYGDLNKSLKMAEKSAHIDATLRMAGLSEVFTQDLEDMKPEQAESPAPTPAPPAKPIIRISAADHRRLEATIKDFGLDRERVKEWVRKACKVEHFSDLSPAQLKRLLAKLKQWADDEAQRLAYEMAAAADAATDEAESAPF